VLDGLEPCNTRRSVYTGRLKDPASPGLQALALGNLPGLCVLTTRLAVADIAAFNPPLPQCSSSTTCRRRQVRSPARHRRAWCRRERRAASQSLVATPWPYICWDLSP
jgi:hypothetical protein